MNVLQQSQSVFTYLFTIPPYNPFPSVHIGTYTFLSSRIMYEGIWDAAGHMTGFGKQRPMVETLEAQNKDDKTQIYYEGQWVKVFNF